MSILLQIGARYKRHRPPFAEQDLSHISNKSVLNFPPACKDRVSHWSHQWHKLSIIFSIRLQPQWHLRQWPTGKSFAVAAYQCLKAMVAFCIRGTNSWRLPADHNVMVWVTGYFTYDLWSHAWFLVIQLSCSDPGQVAVCLYYHLFQCKL